MSDPATPNSSRPQPVPTSAAPVSRPLPIRRATTRRRGRPSERKKTVCIPIGPLFYEVGPDVSLAADTFRAKQLHDEYTETPEYMALLQGSALHDEGEPHRPPRGGAAGGALRRQEGGAGEGHDRPARHRRRQGRDRGQGPGRAPSRKGRWCTTLPSTRRWRSSATSRA